MGLIKKEYVAVTALGLSGVFAGIALLDRDVQKQEPLLRDYGMVDIPLCTDNRGRRVMFVGVPTDKLRRTGTALGKAYRRAGHPMVEYDRERLPRTPPEFQNHVLEHECGHHALGHFDRNISDEAGEREANCYALNAMGYGRREAALIADTMDALYPYDPGAVIQVTVPDMRPSLNSCFVP